MHGESGSAFLDVVQGRMLHGRSLAVARVDLDRFERIPLTHGAAAADAVRAELEARMARAAGSPQLVTRLSDGAYALTIDLIATDAPALKSVANRIMEAVSAPVIVRDQPVIAVGCNVGIVGSDQLDESSALRLLTAAEFAVQEADRLGSRRALVYTAPEQHDPTLHRALFADMLVGLERHEFVPYFQAVHDVTTMSVRGVEALVRWQHPRHGLIMPAEFVPEAEASGLIRQIDADIRRQVLAQATMLPPSLDLTFSLNISGADLDLPTLSDDVCAELSSAGVSPQRLILEVTETALTTDWEDARRNLDMLRAAGVRLAIDDFGTGHMFLDRLSTGLFDILKIDRSLVMIRDAVDDHGVDRERRRHDLLEAIVRMAQTFGMRTVAEGVETESELARVREAGCDRVQGFLLSRPAPLAELLPRLAG